MIKSKKILLYLLISFFFIASFYFSSFVAALTEILINRIRAPYVVASSSSFQVLMASSDVSDFVQRANYLRVAQAHDKRLIYYTFHAKNYYSNQKKNLRTL